MSGGTARRERKVVTVLFCDLVGFTAQAETLDPEDVEAILGPYHERVRSELERHGGTVEKFIGDAVMALFGAPTAHEDDPERAVRAALAIRDLAVEEELQLRVGITTGEALVRWTRARKPARAWPRATSSTRRPACRAPLPSTASSPTRRRTARPGTRSTTRRPSRSRRRARPRRSRSGARSGARSRFGVDVAHEAPRGARRPRRRSSASCATPSTALGTSARRSSSRSSASRASARAASCYELLADRRRRPRAHHLASGPLPRVRRRGHALGARRDRQGPGRDPRAGSPGRRGREDPRRGRGRLFRSRPTRPGSRRTSWPSSGSRARASSEGTAAARPSPPGGASSRRSAEQRPLVLVFEDLHWADESLLDFVDELVDWVTDVPLLVVGTARPELLERRPGWGGGKLNATTLALSPLSDEETALLIAQLLDSPVLAAEEQQALLERAGGNPLYAEQFAELFLERGVGGRASAPGDAPGNHRRAPRRARRRARRSSSRTRPSSARSSGSARSVARRGRRGGAPARARAQGVRPPPAALIGRGRDRARVRARARPRRRLRPDRAPGPRREAPPGR